MKKFCLASVFCVAATVGAGAQTLTTLARFDGTNGGAPLSSLVQGTGGSLYGPFMNYGGGVFEATLSGALSDFYTIPPPARPPSP